MYNLCISEKSIYCLSVMSAAAALTFLPVVPAHAAGFYIQEQSTAGLGASFAGEAAMPRNAATVFFNPAGMTYLDGMQLNAGAHLLLPGADLDNTGSTMVGGPNAGAITGETDNPYDPTPVPNFHFAAPVKDSPDLWFGLSVTAPFGLGNEYDEGWFGRYDSVKTDLLTVNVAPSVAYRLNGRLSIGGGIDIQYADAELSQAIDQGAGDGLAQFKGDDTSVGFNVGLMYDATDDVRLGLHYRSEMNHDLELEYTVFDPAGGVVLQDPGASAELNLPDMVTLAAAYDVNDRWTVMGHLIWYNWSDFEDITAFSSAGTTITSLEQNYKDTWAVALGGEYRYNEEWTFRAGMQFDETPTRDVFRSSRTPDGNRIWASVGATYSFNPALSLDMAATFIDVDAQDINVSRLQPTGGTAQISGKAKQRIGIVALGLNYKF